MNQMRRLIEAKSDFQRENDRVFLVLKFQFGFLVKVVKKKNRKIFTTNLFVNPAATLKRIYCLTSTLIYPLNRSWDMFRYSLSANHAAQFDCLSGLEKYTQRLNISAKFKQIMRKTP